MLRASRSVVFAYLFFISSIAYGTTESAGKEDVRGEPFLQPLAEYTFPIDSGDEGYFTTMQTDGGKIGGGPDFAVTQAEGALHIRTATVAGQRSWGGFSHSTNARMRERALALDPSAPLPWPVRPEFQPHVTGLYARVKGHGTWALEIKQVDQAGMETQVQYWGPNKISQGDFVTLRQDLSNPRLPFKLLNIIVETDSDVWFDEVGFTMDLAALPELAYAFLTSACQVFRCYDPETGQVRDKSLQQVRKFPNEPLSYALDSVPGLGFAAMTAACASKTGFVSDADAHTLALRTITNLLAIANNRGVAHASRFLPHWICLDEDGVTVSPHPNSEFSTVDTALAYLSAYIAAVTLDLKTETAAILAAIRALDFSAVALPGNRISHGFSPQGQLLQSAWTDWGGETALVMILSKLNNPAKTWAYCPAPPVFHGRGFIQELAPLFFERFGAIAAFGTDAKGVDWFAERRRLLEEQKTLVNLPVFIGGRSPCEIVSRTGHHVYFEDEATPPALEDRDANGSPPDLGALWVAPHYPAMISALEPDRAAERIAFMRQNGLFYPLCGPVESVLVDRTTAHVERRHQKQVVLNGWFSAIGYYHAMASEEKNAGDCVYGLTTTGSSEYDAALDSAVLGFWNETPTMPF